LPAAKATQSVSDFRFLIFDCRFEDIQPAGRKSKDELENLLTQVFDSELLICRHWRQIKNLKSKIEKY